jgi:geranylgeranylglycerol-phosphate geranylgeranyltransferase
VSALYAGWLPFVIAALVSTPLMIVYSARFKRRPLTGNLIIAFILALTFIFCSLVFGNVKLGITPAVLAFFYTLIREIIKDLEDLRGDQAEGAQTLPVHIGEKKTRMITSFLLLFLVLVLPFPVTFSLYSKAYLILVLPLVGLPLVAMAVYLWIPRENFRYSFLSQVLKIDMFAGLAAIFAGIHF